MRITYKYLILLVVISLFATTAQFHFPHWWQTIEVIFLAIGILLTGIPHGAMDHYVAKQQAIQAGKPFIIWKFIAGYLVWILVYVLAWWISPSFSLALFLLLSAWHFGETDSKFVGMSGSLKSVRMLVYGICLVAWLLLNHSVELASWIKLLVPASPEISRIIGTAAQVPLYLFFIVAILVLMPIRSVDRQKWIVWILFAGFIFLCGKMSLLSGFALYFTGWHGVLAFIDIHNFLSPKGKLLSVWRNAIPLSAIAYTFLILVYYLSEPTVWQNAGLPAIFILLSVLTLPHAQVMHQLYSRTKTV